MEKNVNTQSFFSVLRLICLLPRKLRFHYSPLHVSFLKQCLLEHILLSPVALNHMQNSIIDEGFSLMLLSNANIPIGEHRKGKLIMQHILLRFKKNVTMNTVIHFIRGFNITAHPIMCMWIWQPFPQPPKLQGLRMQDQIFSCKLWCACVLSQCI